VRRVEEFEELRPLLFSIAYRMLGILDGQIQTIRTVINPDKLGHVGPVGDAWAAFREANQGRRPAD